MQQKHTHTHMQVLHLAFRADPAIMTNDIMTAIIRISLKSSGNSNGTN